MCQTIELFITEKNFQNIYCASVTSLLLVRKFGWGPAVFFLLLFISFFPWVKWEKEKKKTKIFIDLLSKVIWIIGLQAAAAAAATSSDKHKQRAEELSRGKRGKIKRNRFFCFSLLSLSFYAIDRSSVGVVLLLRLKPSREYSQRVFILNWTPVSVWSSGIVTSGENDTSNTAR